MQILKESGQTFLYGMMSKADAVNRNNRIYPKKALKSATLDLSEKVNDDSIQVYSELEHPPYLDLKMNDRVCGELNEVTWNDKEGAAYCKVLIYENTKAGKKLMESIKKSIHVGISTRGSGSLVMNESKVGVVQDDLKFATADIILEGIQSCQTCVMKLNEGYETYYIDDVLLEAECGCTNIMEKLNDDDIKVLQEKLIDSFKNIIK